jgi:hypothetical protein
MTTYCGTTTLRTKKLPILWTGENAEHIARHHMETPDIRPLHVEVQKALQRAVNNLYKRSIYIGVKEEAGYTMRIVWQKRGKLAEIKSAINLASTAKSILKSKSVGAARNKKLENKITVDDLPEVEKEFAAENNIPIEDYVKVLNKYYQKKRRNPYKK